MISVVIPNYNGGATIGACLDAVFSSDSPEFEVIVVDDGSDDGSPDIVRLYPCRLVTLPGRRGTARARNVGAARSRGETIFFTDADCLVGKDTIRRAAESLAAYGPGTVVGGTYSSTPADSGFYSFFQSVFINYHETHSGEAPDYVAAHAMVVDAGTFRKSGGFSEDFLPIIEDVEYSHRLRRSGVRLVMDAGIQVSHIFDFSLPRSLRNAFRKAFYWTIYSSRNGDLLADSGTASRGLKANAAIQALCIAALLLSVVSGAPGASAILLPAILINFLVNQGLVRAFFRSGGRLFGAKACLYYFSIFPMAAAVGGLAGWLRLFRQELFHETGMQWRFHRSGTQDQ